MNPSSEPTCEPTRPERRRTRHPLVSVCIVNWNCREYLRACLRTLSARQQRVRLEVIVVDNASTDGAADMVALEFPRVRLIRNTSNVGFARGNNQAAAVARGRYLFFLNNDTEVPTGALRKLVSAARIHPEASILGPRLVEPSGDVQTSWRDRPTITALLHRTTLFRWTNWFRQAYRDYRGRDVVLNTPTEVEVLLGAALLMRRKTFRKLGGWDESFTFGGEDIDLCTRAAAHGTILYHPETTILHHGRVSSRQAIGYAYGNTVVGITRCLHKAGASPGALFGYKLALTLNAPIAWTLLMLAYLWRRLRGQTARADKCRTEARGLGHFLTRHLLAFWRA